MQRSQTLAMQETWLTSVSVANAPCLHMTTTLHARSVGWQLANPAWIWRIPAIFFVGIDFQTVGETEKVLGGRQSESQPARVTALGLQPSLNSKCGFLSKPVSASGSRPTSEISSQAGEDDFEDNLLNDNPRKALCLSGPLKSFTATPLRSSLSRDHSCARIFLLLRGAGP